MAPRNQIGYSRGAVKSKAPSHDDRPGDQAAEPHVFVLRVGTKAPAVEESISAIGEVELLGDSGLRLVRLSEPHGDARATWKVLLDRVRGLEWAAPAIRSPEGAEHYPTGKIAVRFAANQTLASLRAFARAHGLELVRKNEFVPSQATFVPQKPVEVFLPDSVREVAKDPSVHKAWAETISKYKREAG